MKSYVTIGGTMRKKVLSLLAAAALLPGLSATAQAVDFKTKGVWIMNFEYGGGGNFMERGRSINGVQANRTTGWGRYNEDQFESKSRVRLQLDAVASEALSGTVYFEIGRQYWGQAGNKSGAALGADGSNVIKIKHSYLDWTMPQTDVKVRMGIQRIFLPDYVTEASQSFDADTAGITVSVPVNEHLSLTGFWARAYNDNWAGNDNSPQSYLDNFDLFGLTAPLRFEGVNITPWGLVGAFGSNTFRKGNDFYGKNNDGAGALGVAPATYALSNGKVGRQIANAYSTIFWAGLTGEAVAWNPFRLAWSFNYGQSDTGVETLNRKGWYGSLLAEYSMDWGVPGIYGWYTSGDDGNVKNGSERMPTIEANNESTNGLDSFGTLGTLTLGRDTLLGSTFVGTWGVGARVKDVSFLDKLKHTFHANLLGGTNSPTMAKYIKGQKDVDGQTLFRPDVTPGSMGDFNTANYYGLYLTSRDYAAEFGVTSTYQMYDNFKIVVEANYIALWLDQSKDVWGGYSTTSGARMGGVTTQDAWNVNMSFIYKF